MELAFCALVENTHRLCGTDILHSYNFKFPEVVVMKMTAADVTMCDLHQLTSCYGLHEQVISGNNGHSLCLKNSKLPQKQWSQAHLLSPIPSIIKWCCETLVQTFKKTLRAWKPECF